VLFVTFVVKTMCLKIFLELPKKIRLTEKNPKR